MRFVIVTGLSGAGKSMTMRTMEDMGYYCIDNMPPILMPKVAELCASSQEQFAKVAVASDIRGGELFHQLLDTLDDLERGGFPYEILFLTASDEELIKRYKETRRKHPLENRETRLPQAIEQERKLLKKVQEHANHVIDTTDKLQKQLRAEVEQIFRGADTGSAFAINVMSFGFKYGIPLDADLVFDVRFLSNPYYIAELKRHTGLEQVVADYVMGFPESKAFRDKLFDLIDFLLPEYKKEGKSQLLIAIGCTGGKHRSVTLAEELFHHLQGKHNVIATHRDVQKGPRA